MTRLAKTVIVAQATPRQEELWRVALLSQGLDVLTVSRDASLAAIVADDGPPGDLLLVDLARLASQRLPLPHIARGLRKRGVAARPIATLGARLEVAEAERRWARRQGALDLFPAVSLATLEQNASPWLRRALAALRLQGVEVARLRTFLRVLARDADASFDIGGRALADLAGRGTGLDSLAAKMRGPDGVERRDRRHGLKVYTDCFTGSGVVDWIASACELDRDGARAVGQALLERGLFHHIVKEHPLRDGKFLYRFAGDADRLDAIEIDDLTKRMRGPGGVDIRDRFYRGTRYSSCFVGEEAVLWMARAYRLAREEATSLGQRLVDLHLVHHVVDEHEFADGYYFYRFYADERR